MKMGIRKPSIKRSIKARTTGKIKRKVKATVNPFYGKKGMGLVNNPKKAIYNKVYNKTTIGINDVIAKTATKSTIKSVHNENKSTTNELYTIINSNEVIIANKKYSSKSIKNFSFIFLILSILLLIVGLLILPIGILFVLFAIFIFLVSKNYKKIYNEMCNFTQNELNKSDVLKNNE